MSPSLADKIAALQESSEKQSDPVPEKSAQRAPVQKRVKFEGVKKGRNFMLSHDVYELLDLIKFRTKTPMGEIVDEAIREYATKHGYSIN